MPPRTGRVVAGRYRLIEPIGRGAMGVVWRASDQLLDRDVAVKEVQLNASLGDAERANAYRRTLREARTAARLSHRGVVTVFDVVEEDGRPWIIMELIRSQSLDALLATDGPMPAKRAARIAEQLLSALAHAHAAGVLHRDVKPSNVLIATSAFDERAVLTDFGIAQFAGDPRLTQTGMVMGSPGFTAPERIRGGDATPASDLWSLGATMYAACEGRGPYEQRGGAITTMTAIINEDAPAAPAADRLGGVIAALLRRDPARRPTASAAASMIAEMLPTLPDVRRGRVQRTATVLAPAPVGRSPARDGSGSGSPAAAPEGAGLVPPPAAPLSSDVAPTGLDAPEPAVSSHDKPRPPAKAPTAAKAALRAPAASASAAPAAAAPAPASSPAATPAPRPPAASAATPATPATPGRAAASKAPSPPESPAHAPEVTPAADSVATTSDGSRSGMDCEVKVDEVPRTGTPAPEAASDPEATAAETPDLSPNAPSATVAPEPPAGAAAAGMGEAAAGTLTAVAAGRDAPVQAAGSAGGAEPAVAASGNGQGTDAGADEQVTAPTVPVRVLAPVTEISADAVVSAPVKAAASYSPPAPRTARAPAPDKPGTDKPEKDAWWATAYQADRSSSRQSPSQPGGSGPKSLPPWASSGPGTVPPWLSYQQQPSPSGAGAKGKRGRGRLTAVLAIAAVVIIAVVVVATMLAMHGNHGSTPGARTRTSPVSSTSAALPVPPLTKDDVAVVRGIDHPDTAVASGWTPERLTPAQTGTAAGFSINVPPGWQVMPQQSSPMRFFIDAPDGISNVEIDLAPPAKSDMVAQAEFVKHTSLAQGAFPRYQEIDLKAVNVRDTRGALWRFDWVNKNGTEIRVDDMFFVLSTKNGPQSYAIYMTAPEGNTWSQQILPLVQKMLQSFAAVTSGG